MKKETNRIDDLFREGMEEHLEMPSPIVWDRIEEELDKKDKRRPLILFLSSYKKVAAILIIGIISASLFAGGYLLMKKLSNQNKEDIVESEKVKSEKNTSIGQPKENTIHHIPVDSGTQILNVDPVSEKDFQLTDNSKDQLIKKYPSNEAVASLPYVQKSVPFKNKPEVAGSQKIDNSAGNMNNNALPVPATEEQNKLASNAIVQQKQQEFVPTEESVVPKQQPISEKTPATLSAPATTDTANSSEIPAQIPVLDKKKNKNIYFSITPIIQIQYGDKRIVDKAPPPAPPSPLPGPTPPIVTTSNYKVLPTTYKPNVGILSSLHVGNTFSVQTGFSLVSQYFELESNDLVAEKRPDGKTKYRLNCGIGSFFIEPKSGRSINPGDIEELENIKTTYNHIYIPIQANYFFGKRKIHPYITAGTGLHFLTDLNVAGVMADLNEKHKIKDQELFLRSSFMNGTIGGGIKIDLSKQVSYIFATQYQFALTPDFKVEKLKAFPNTINIQTGLQFSFRK